MLDNSVGFAQSRAVQLDENGFEDTGDLKRMPGGGVDISGFTPPQRAAIILVSMGPEYAGPIVQKLEDSHMREFINALKQLHSVPREAILAVIAEFIVLINKNRGVFRAGPEKAMDIARSILAEDRIGKLTGGVVNISASMSEADIWEQMATRTVEDIAQFITAYGEDVIAYILKNLPTDCAADTLSLLPAKMSVTVVAQLAGEQCVAPVAQKAIQQLIRTEFLAVSSEGADDAAIGFVAGLLSLVSKEKRDTLLTSMEKTDKDRAQKIRSGMITFEDIPVRLPVTAIQLVIKEYDKNAFMDMIKVGMTDEPDVIEFLMNNISQRMAGQMREGAEEMADIPAKKRDKVISSFMTFISQLEKDGKITLIKPVVDE